MTRRRSTAPCVAATAVLCAVAGTFAWPATAQQADLQLALHSFLDLPGDFSFYAGVRYVDELPNQNVDSYVATDLNLGWAFHANGTVSHAVQNAADDTHPEFEFGPGNLIERSAYLKLDWRF